MRVPGESPAFFDLFFINRGINNTPQKNKSDFFFFINTLEKKKCQIQKHPFVFPILSATISIKRFAWLKICFHQSD